LPSPATIIVPTHGKLVTTDDPHPDDVQIEFSKGMVASTCPVDNLNTLTVAWH
jgi:hypothetical protein